MNRKELDTILESIDTKVYEIEIKQQEYKNIFSHPTLSLIVNSRTSNRNNST